jgi:hypothetical protein
MYCQGLDYEPKFTVDGNNISTRNIVQLMNLIDVEPKKL